MRNIALILQFDGSAYHGWQRQNNAISICEMVTNAVNKITKEDCEIIGCSRTDAGVHALEYVCNFKSNTAVPLDKLPLALNTKLPDDIRVIKSTEADDEFHSRYSAISKTYIYKVYTNNIANPFLTRFAYHFPYKLNSDELKKAAIYFCGTHDFSAFMSMGSSQKTTVRTVNYLNIKNNDGMFEFEINADSYLYNMVRIIVGTLLSVGCGSISSDDIPGIIKSCSRKRAGATAPAHGLYLKKIYY